tara:strand:+ start:47 stop:478 length:432 start_codon:yes stop_codon:yes gene_type:complete
MFQKLNLQYFLSYFGIFPLFFIILDKYFFFQINEEIILDFSIYYSLLIFVFIGSINWNLEIKPNNYIVIYGFLPSLLSVIILFMNLYNFNSVVLVLLLIFFLLTQLFLDYVLIYSNNVNKYSFYYLRTPLTLIITIFLGIIIF